MAHSLIVDDLLNAKYPAPNIISSGQPTAEQLSQAISSGIRYVIDLRAPNENRGYDEATLVTKQGCIYINLPIDGRDDLTLENVRRMEQLLAEHQQSPILVHCASGNRNGALMALVAGWLHDKPKTEAIETGRQWGLTTAEPAVLQLLTNHPKSS